EERQIEAEPLTARKESQRTLQTVRPERLRIQKKSCDAVSLLRRNEITLSMMKA
ncbi:MAG: hypothetical protein HW374_355, partial [Bacteroidetes bacterium]|nr:hypothetical protein [Bacteroidota bacterium]